MTEVDGSAALQPAAKVSGASSTPGVSNLRFVSFLWIALLKLASMSILARFCEGSARIPLCWASLSITSPSGPIEHRNLLAVHRLNKGLV